MFWILQQKRESHKLQIIDTTKNTRAKGWFGDVALMFELNSGYPCTQVTRRRKMVRYWHLPSLGLIRQNPGLFFTGGLPNSPNQLVIAFQAFPSVDCWFVLSLTSGGWYTSCSGAIASWPSPSQPSPLPHLDSYILGLMLLQQKILPFWHHSLL